MWFYFFVNILLSGEKQVGKTTALSKYLDTVQNRQGFLTEEVRLNGRRTGFEIVSHLGTRAALASIDSPSQSRVGRYGVEIDNIDMMAETIGDPLPGNLLYIDELGRMELHSEIFRRMLVKYLDAPSPFIGTINDKYRDGFVDSVLARPDLHLVEVTIDNRDFIPQQLKEMAG